MSDYSHHVLAAIQEGRFFRADDKTTPFGIIDATRIKETFGLISSSQRFDFAEIGLALDNELILTAFNFAAEDMLAIPFDKMFLNFGHVNTFDAASKETMEEKVVSCALVYLDAKRNELIVSPIFRYAHTNEVWFTYDGVGSLLLGKPTDNFIYYGDKDDEATYTAVLRQMALAVCAIAMLDARDIVTIEERAPEKLNRARVKRGALPLSDYHIVKIGNNVVRSRPSGNGAHASPRLHWRRGHIRRLPDGRKTKVKACLVGDAARGFINHDYAVEA